MEQQERPLETVRTIASMLESFGLGMPDATVPLMPHNPLWAEAFLWIKSKIHEQLGFMTTLPKIEHFGSTCIPGIVAKPVLDMILIFDDLKTLQQAIRPREELGFIYEGDAVSEVEGVAPDPCRHAFSFRNVSNDVNYIYLHAYVQGHPNALRNLQFRDKLLLSPELAKEYGALKELWRNSNSSRREYSRAKDPFIKKVESMENRLFAKVNSQSTQAF